MEKKYNPAIEEIKLTTRKSYEGKCSDDKLIFVVKGIIHLLPEERLVKKNICKKMFILSKGTSYHILVEEECILLFFSFQGYMRLLEHFFPLTEISSKKNEFKFLPIHDKVFCFLETIQICLSEGEKNPDYAYIKLYELMLLLNNYYEKDTLQDFFLPLREINHTFSNFVMENYWKVKTVKELATLSNYSLSAFKKHFHETFGQAPYHWMKTQKAIRLYSGLSLTDMSLTEICDLFGFSSLSQLTAFCKTNFGKSPSMIRKAK